MAKNNQNTSALAALTSAALGLPGLSASVQAGTPATDASVSYEFTRYDEGGISKGKRLGSQGQRYQINIHQVKFIVPLGESMDFSLDYSLENMGGASPWYILPGGDGKPLQVLSGATIREERNDFVAALGWYSDWGTVTTRLGYSTEKDYQSLSGSVTADFDFNDQLTTVSVGLGYSDDEIEPTDSNIFTTRVVHAIKTSRTVFASLSQVLGQNDVIQSGISYSHHSGFLSDPYKLVFVDGILAADSRPDQRDEFALTTQYRHFFTGLDAALHADYRFYQDDWSVTSNTVTLSWYQNIGDWWRIIPSLRYYSQDDAEFYAPYFTATPIDGFFANDYRLSAFGALSFGLEVDKRIDDWEFSLSGKYYMSDASLAINSSGAENPGLVDFWYVTAGLKKTF